MNDYKDIIEVKNLAKKFDGTTAVDDVSFAIEPGELFGFLGPNGAGKTTTINMLTGWKFCLQNSDSDRQKSLLYSKTMSFVLVFIFSENGCFILPTFLLYFWGWSSPYNRHISDCPADDSYNLIKDE